MGFRILKMVFCILKIGFLLLAILEYEEAGFSVGMLTSLFLSTADFQRMELVMYLFITRSCNEMTICQGNTKVHST